MNNQNYKRKQININDILLNTNKPRFEKVENQENAFEIIVNDSEEKIYNLAKHIAENGINPTESATVIKYDNSKYTLGR